MRAMCEPGNVNTLARYAARGGKVWLLGGGGALASLLPFNRTGNDIPTTTFVFNHGYGEMFPGQMLVDVGGWRSEIRSASENTWAQRFGGRLEGSAAIASLPPLLELKTPASDALPPYRRPSDFYPSVANVEYLEVPNEIVEGGVSTLDTLYETVGGGLPRPDNPHEVVMTHFHGRPLPKSFVMSGFDLWNWKRSQSIRVVDFVLGDLWGLSREPVAARAASLFAAKRVAATAPRLR
jgi:hypothetical protein